MAVDKFLVRDDKFVVKDNEFVTVDVPDDCECCDSEVVCPTDCTSCPNTLTAVITCPLGTFTNITFTKQGQPTGCSWNPDFHSGYSITSLDCKTAAQADTCGTASPGFVRFAFCITAIPENACTGFSFVNIDFHKAISSGCPATGLYTSSDGGWTATLS